MRKKAIKMLVGQNGYIDYNKSKYLKIGIGFLMIVLVIYIIGKVLMPNYFIYFKVGSALMILPTAQYFSKYFLFYRYKSGSKETYEALQAISEQLLIFSDLIIVRGKKTIYCDFIVISDKQIVVCFKNYKEKSDNQFKKVKALIQELYQVKGYTTPVEIIDNDQGFIDYVKKNVKGTLNNIDTELQEQLGKIIIQNAI